MRKILILGSSQAGVAAAYEIRRQDDSAEITIVTFDDVYPGKRESFIPLISQKAALKDVYCRTEKDYEKNKIKVVTNQKPLRINYKKNIFFTQEKEQFEFDVLLITDAPGQKFPDIKGTNKKGTIGFRQMKDMVFLHESLQVVESIAIQATSPSSLILAQAIAERSRDVQLIVPQVTSLSEWTQGQWNEETVAAWQAKGLHILLDNEIREILGESDVKAIRLKTEKVLAAQVVIFFDALYDLKFFQDSPLEIQNTITVNEQFQSSLPQVFALDDIAGKVGDWEAQGKAVAEAALRMTEPSGVTS